MASTAILVAAVGVGGTLVGSIVTGGFALYRTKIQQEGQDRRRRAEHYIGVEIEYLTRIYDVVLRCDRYIHGLSSDYEEDMELWRQYAENRRDSDIQDALTELETAVRNASILLNDEEAKTMSEHLVHTVGLFQEMGSIDEPGVNSDQYIMDQYRQSRNEVKRILRTKINQPTETIIDN